MTMGARTPSLTRMSARASRWRGEIADRHVRLVFSNGPVEKLALLGDRVRRALATAANPNLRWLIELCLAGMGSVCSRRSGMSSCWSARTTKVFRCSTPAGLQSPRTRRVTLDRL
jgi:hypothetical protein